MKLKKLISRLNKENEPPDGWQPEDKVQATSKKKQASRKHKQELTSKHK